MDRVTSAVVPRVVKRSSETLGGAPAAAASEEPTNETEGLPCVSLAESWGCDVTDPAGQWQQPLARAPRKRKIDEWLLWLLSCNDPFSPSEVDRCAQTAVFYHSSSAAMIGKRLPWRRWAPALCLAICLLCVVQLWSTLSWTRHRGLRPRLSGDVLVRGRTYQVHLREPLHAHHLRVHEERVRANRLAKPHLVARRQILEVSSGATTSEFLGRDQQDAWPNVTCTTCSLVGFSGHLLQSGLGSAVDGSDCVIRLGLAPIRGYDADVGQKTTFRMIDAASLHEAQRKRHATSALGPGRLVVFGTARPDRWNPKKLPGHVQLLRLKRAAEHRAAASLAQSALSLGYALSGTEASGLWHAVRLVDNVGCSSVRIFGVPDPKACKRRKNDPTRSNYWAPWSAGQCSDGLDAGANHDPRLPDPLQLSLADRRALAGWTSSRTVRFDAPPWPSERG